MRMLSECRQAAKCLSPSCRSSSRDAWAARSNPLRTLCSGPPAPKNSAAGVANAADHAPAGLRFQLGRFVEQVETEMAIGGTFVALREIRPVQAANAQGFIVRPERFFLRRFGPPYSLERGGNSGTHSVERQLKIKAMAH